MAEQNQSGNEGKDDEDYMGDLSKFIPTEISNPSKPAAAKKISSSVTSVVQSSKKKSKSVSWQEQRRLERERKQREDDEKLLTNIEAPIPQSNIGFKMLKQMGYSPGTALGKEGSGGRAEPVGIQIRRSRVGIGREDPHTEKRKREELEAEINRQNEEALLEDFGSRKKSQWRSKRVVVNFRKAKAALDQLENREVVEPEKSDDEEGEQDEEEEEVISEEDLQEILMKLRDEHRYCLFCGFQYETMESLLSNCPGADEDDH